MPQKEQGRSCVRFGTLLLRWDAARPCNVCKPFHQGLGCYLKWDYKVNKRWFKYTVWLFGAVYLFIPPTSPGKRRFIFQRNFKQNSWQSPFSAKLKNIRSKKKKEITFLFTTFGQIASWASVSLSLECIILISITNSTLLYTIQAADFLAISLMDVYFYNWVHSLWQDGTWGGESRCTIINNVKVELLSNFNCEQVNIMRGSAFYHVISGNLACVFAVRCLQKGLVWGFIYGGSSFHS